MRLCFLFNFFQHNNGRFESNSILLGFKGLNLAHFTKSGEGGGGGCECVGVFVRGVWMNTNVCVYG